MTLKPTRPQTCLGNAGDVVYGRGTSFDAAMPRDSATRRSLRKWWEWEYITGCAEALGLLNPNTVALGLGVGDEPLIFHLANRCGSVVATDLYAGNNAWREARYAHTDRIYELSPFPYERSRLRVANCDMRQLFNEDESVDLVWSTSSIEHVPTLMDLHKVLCEVQRVLRPGGVAVLTTEWAVGGTPYLLPGVNAWDEAVLGCMREGFAGLEWLGPTDLSYDWTLPANGTRARRHMSPLGVHRGALSLMPHHRGGDMANCVGITAIAPVGFAVRKRDNTRLAFDAIAWPEDYRVHTQALRRYHLKDDHGAMELFDPLLMRLREQPDRRQMALHVARFALECQARSGLRGRLTQEHRIHELLELHPPGDQQDADCLDLCAYLAGEMGLKDLASAIDARCMDSPSTTFDHTLSLALRYLRRQGGQGSEAAQQKVAGLVLDLAVGGVPFHEIDRVCFTPLRKTLDRETAVQVERLCRERVASWHAELLQPWER